MNRQRLAHHDAPPQPGGSGDASFQRGLVELPLLIVLAPAALPSRPPSPATRPAALPALPLPLPQLERLATQSQGTFAPLAHQFSLPAGGPPVPIPPLLHQRPSSLFALVQQQASGGQGSPDGAQRGRLHSGTTQGGGLLGKLGKLARTGSRDRTGTCTPGSGSWGGDGSARSSATSLGDAQAALADLQQRQTSSFSAAAGGAAGNGTGATGPRKGSGNRIAPDDAV